MSTDPTHPEDENESPRPESGEDDLTDALGTLEHMLDRRGEATPTFETDPPIPDEDDHSIPLLNDVLNPEGAPAEAPEGVAMPHRDLLAGELHHQLVERLSSELEVIVQAGLEEAMKAATESISARAREHLRIILPEIIEEVVRDFENDGEPD